MRNLFRHMAYFVRREVNLHRVDSLLVENELLKLRLEIAKCKAKALESALSKRKGEIAELRVDIERRAMEDATKETNRDAALKVLFQMGVKVPCNAFHIEHGKAVCWGTKECDACSCGGDKTRCTHYPHRVYDTVA